MDDPAQISSEDKEILFLTYQKLVDEKGLQKAEEYELAVKQVAACYQHKVIRLCALSKVADIEKQYVCAHHHVPDQPYFYDQAFPKTLQDCPHKYKEGGRLACWLVQGFLSKCNKILMYSGGLFKDSDNVEDRKIALGTLMDTNWD